jgi:4'-phosphopantetheinyl transferase EntD
MSRPSAPRGFDPEAATVPALTHALRSFAPPGILVGHRRIAAGDETALMPEETATITTQAVAARRASGAARMVARQLLAELGHAPCPILKAASGAPLWPQGVVGSLAHDDEIAVAAVAAHGTINGLGVDIEPAAPLPLDMIDLVASPRERLALGDDPHHARLLFAAKEAVYKAVHPLDGVFLEFHDIAVDLAGRTASVRSGRKFDLRFCVSTHLVALALA